MIDRTPDIERDDPRQVLIHPVLWPAFVDWLAARELEVRCVGTFSEDDLPTWIVSPTDEAMRRVR